MIVPCPGRTCAQAASKTQSDFQYLHTSIEIYYILLRILDIWTSVTSPAHSTSRLAFRPSFSQADRSVGAAKSISISSGCLTKQDNFISEKRNDQTILLNFLNSLHWLLLIHTIRWNDGSAEKWDKWKDEIWKALKYVCVRIWEQVIS